MSSSQSQASKEAIEQNRLLAESYYELALPALQTRLGSINASLAKGEPGYLQSAYQGQRAGLTEGLAARGGAAQAQQMRGSKAALSGGNQFAALHPADIGAQLANALYGSKFQEGQANLDQQFNLISMGLGGAGTAGNAALTASGQQLGAIGYLPQYNQTYANIVGGAALGTGLYGALNQAGVFSSQPAWTMPQTTIGLGSTGLPIQTTNY
jgi:hypothetical protein